MTAQTKSVAADNAVPWPRAEAMCKSPLFSIQVPAAASEMLPDDLAREVYCILGIPVDAIGMAAVVRRIELAAANAAPFLISTPNLNFLISSQSDTDFRESLLLSDLCPADGMPIVWIARLMGLPIGERIAGSEIFETLKSGRGAASPLKVFLFGGAEGIATMASRALNARPGGMVCVGTLSPGFGSLDEMSTDETIAAINASQAEFLAVALGAAKGQEWLRQNHHRLRIPVRSHLGATINFQAGTVQRAPDRIGKLGFEWLWRIKEEPQLWRRYWNDGVALLRLLFTRVLPLMILARWQRFWPHQQDLLIKRSQDHHSVILSLSGFATARQTGQAVPRFRDALAEGRPITIDLSDTRVIDARFFGLILMVRKQLAGQGTNLNFIGLSPRIKRLFTLHGLGFLLSSNQEE